MWILLTEGGIVSTDGASVKWVIHCSYCRTSGTRCVDLVHIIALGGEL